MDPLTLGLFVAALVASSASVGWLSWRHGHRKGKEGLREQYRELQLAGKTYWKVAWEGRRYSGLPRENLQALAEDLRAYDDLEVTLTLTIQGQGGWKNIIRRNWKNGRGQRIHRLTDLVYQGPPKRVLQEIERFLKDDDHGFCWSNGNWRDQDSPLILEVDLSVEYPEEGEEKEPEPEIVVDPETLAPMIEAILEVREAEGRPLRAGSMSETDRKAILNQAAKQRQAGG